MASFLTHSIIRYLLPVLLVGLLLNQSSLAHLSVSAQSPVAVYATRETTPVLNPPDAADDAAIWIHPTDPALSTIIGTDKKGYLEVYDLSGAVLQRIPFATNNVDIRYNFPLGQERVALVTGVDRTAHKLFAYKINPETRLLEDVSTPSTIVGLQGSAMYVSPVTGKYYAFTNHDSVLNQYELFDNGSGRVGVNLVRTVTFGSFINLTEGVAADDIHAKVYVSEEAVAIWKLGAEPGDGGDKIMVDQPIAQGGHFQPDIEGLAIYYKSDGTGYLFGSSQGDSTFTVYTREGNNAYLGTFNIAPGAIDQVNGTDGIDVTNFPLGSAFPYGMFIAQDGRNTDGNVSLNQNFKLVPFEVIATALNLTMDTSWDPRLVGASLPPANQPPTAEDDSYATAVETPLMVSTPGVLTNDSDPDGDALTAVLVTGPAHGTLSLNGDGAFTYTPNVGFTGADSFTYHAHDGAAGSNIATVAITVASGNQPPVVNVGADQTIIFPNHAILDGTVTDDGLPNPPGAVTVSWSQVSGSGAVTFGDASAVDTTASFSAADVYVLRLTASDGDLSTFDELTVTVNLPPPPNQPPTAQDDSACTVQNRAVTINVAANDRDPDGNLHPASASTTCEGCTHPTHGALVNHGNGTFTYTPNPGFSSNDSFVYEICDTAGACDTAAVTITVASGADLIFADGFESGNLSAWSANRSDGGDLSVSPAAALVGSNGLQAVIDDSLAIYTDSTSAAEPRYRARFYFDPNSITMANGDNHYLFYGYSGSFTAVLRVQLSFANNSYQLRAALRDDGNTWRNSSWATLSDAPHVVELDWQAATAPGANDGALSVWLDGVQHAEITGVDNDTRRIDRVRLGAVAGIDSGTGGVYYFDAFESRRQSYIGAAPGAQVANTEAMPADPAALHIWTEEEAVPEEEMEPEEAPSHGLYLPLLQR